MFRLSPRMMQHLRSSLKRYHELFDGGRCQAWELEELLVKAMKADTTLNVRVSWQEAGHDDKADIIIEDDHTTHHIQVKSGRLTKSTATISGNRLGRFDGDLEALTKYLQTNHSQMISVWYRQMEDTGGREHQYMVTYLDPAHLRDVDPDAWTHLGAAYLQTNVSGIEFSLRPSMSWQIWWKVPLELFETTGWFSANS